MPETLNGEVLDRVALVSMGVTPAPPGEVDLDPKTKVKKVKTLKTGIYRRPLALSPEKVTDVKKLLKSIWEESDQNTSLEKSKLLRANYLMEGIKEPKTFPWINCCALHIPLIEIQITILHSVVSNTMLENDPIFYVKAMLDNQAESADSDIEKFLHWVCKIQLRIDVSLSDIYWNTYKDGTAIGDLDWVEEYGTRYDYLRFSDPADFQKRFPSAKEAGLSDKEYNDHLLSIMQDGEVQVKVEEFVIKYRGPKLRVVELNNFVMVPVTAPDPEYALFVGDTFLQRGDYFRRKVKEEWFDTDEVEKMLKTRGVSNAPDTVSQAQDNIEGLSRNRVTTPDEYFCLQGILKINLSEDEMEPEKMHLVVYHKDSDALLRIEEYPYWHNRCKYITWRFKKRPNRHRGQSIYDQCVDMNDEVDTQHQQRIDSRTISTVPSFLTTDNAEYDPTRADQKFYPGVRFKVKSKNDMVQLTITQTDMGQSLQEEQTLMSLMEQRTGSGDQVRSSGATSRDPRASGKKAQLQVQQSNLRVDDHMRELKISTAECGSQILELYYQFSPDMVPFAKKDPATQQFVKAEVERAKLRGGNMFLEVARTTVMDNPTAMAQRALMEHEFFMKDPMVGGDIFRHRALLHRTATALRMRDVDKIVPTVDQLLQELKKQSALGGPAASSSEQALHGHLNNAPQAPGQSHQKKAGAPPMRASQPQPGT